MSKFKRSLAGLAGAAALLLALSACTVNSVDNSSDKTDKGSSSSSDSDEVKVPSIAKDGGLEVGTGLNEIDVWVDYQCSHCRDFEESNGDYLTTLVETDNATVRIHPLYFLDRGAVDGSSFRAGNALACVADQSPDVMLEYSAKLFAADKWSDQIFVELADDLDVSGVDSCIEDLTFGPWLTESMKDAMEGDSLPATTEIERVQSTPTVVVNGAVYKGDPKSNSAFVSFFEANQKN
ncbi:DsbA family protein [Lysinibacter cavernae]|uniref:Protein-disulfide isomerase n=1 Tax=Lysinibacter cavernae TaxID=1640652 RepID=A0A7X5R203_9MICO|nr:thioredoxin domain-containing protein [Lysinibacter cavernae]NIH54193.1 protein-disulfide isomerase [Lysinibacter cavernae]